MTATEYAQKCLDTEGFLVIGGSKKHSVGDVIEDRVQYRNEFRHDFRLVVVGLATHEDSVAQVRRISGGLQEQRWKALYYYKVTAE